MRCFDVLLLVILAALLTEATARLFARYLHLRDRRR